MKPWQFKLLYDGECPLCQREVDWLNKRNQQKLLILEDISNKNFNPQNYGKSLDELMGSIHGVFPSGDVISGVEVFRQSYRAVGLGWLIAPTGWPILRPIFDWLYKIFARYRIRIGGFLGRNCSEQKCSIEKTS